MELQDANDNRPQFASSVYEESLMENSEIGRIVTVVSATDEDSGTNAQLSYSIVAGNSEGMCTL